jgi:Uroporphyrinogen decarboxylase (URO-D)
MAEQATPRSVVKALLRGEQQARPLLMPLIFSLGARLENVPLGTFVANPTKIVNALRQIRGTLKVDGLACYFDPFLEIEALGGKLEWTAAGATLTSRPIVGNPETLPDQLGTPGDVLKKGRIPVAQEVLKRLKVMLKDEPALMVGVTGPLTLVSQLWSAPQPPPSAVQFAAEITASLAKHFVEAGADVVFLIENAQLPEQPEYCEWWSKLLDPIINVIRFYEALPVLMLSSMLGPTSAQWITNRNWDCAVCLSGTSLRGSPSASYRIGVSLPNTLFHAEGDHGESLETVRRNATELNPVFLTTAADVPADADMKRVASVLGHFRGVLLSPG